MYGARKKGLQAVEQRQRARLADMVTFARAHSPYYREWYRDIPTRVKDPTLLPVTRKKELMARLNDWVTDPTITLAQAQEFVNNPELIGEGFAGKYKVATTSGTTGRQGIFVLDERGINVAKAVSIRILSEWFDRGDVAKLIAKGGKMAMLFATGGHFASAVASSNLQHENWL